MDFIMFFAGLIGVGIALFIIKTTSPNSTH